MPQERKHLAFQLRDTKTVVSKLENVCGVIFHLIMVIFYLVIFDVRPSPAPSESMTSRACACCACQQACASLWQANTAEHMPYAVYCCRGTRLRSQACCLSPCGVHCPSRGCCWRKAEQFGCPGHSKAAGRGKSAQHLAALHSARP